MIVNETFARKYFKGESPLGRRMGMGGEKGPLDMEIIGVAKDGKYDSLRNEKLATVYVPFAQDPHPGYISFSVRTAAKPEAVLADIRRVISQLDPTLAMWSLSTMEAQVEESLFVERMTAMLCACFGLLATILAAVGLYGVMAYSVARRDPRDRDPDGARRRPFDGAARGPPGGRDPVRDRGRDRPADFGGSRPVHRIAALRDQADRSGSDGRGGAACCSRCRWPRVLCRPAARPRWIR